MSNGNVVIVGAARTPIGKYAIIKSFKSYQTLVELYVEWFLSVAVYHSSNLSGTLNGSLSSLKAHELGSAAITGALIRSNVRPEEVSDVIMGQVSFLFVNSQVSNIDFLSFRFMISTHGLDQVFNEWLYATGFDGRSRAKPSSSSGNERANTIRCPSLCGEHGMWVWTKVSAVSLGGILLITINDLVYN